MVLVPVSFNCALISLVIESYFFRDHPDVRIPLDNIG